MKIKYPIIYLALAGMIVFMCSYREGAAYQGWDCTGGETGLGNGAGCASGNGCHASAATPGIAVTLELDSAGVPVTGYKPGLTYTVIIKGVNNTTNMLPRYGFQVAAFKGSTADSTPVNTGTFQQTGLPTGVHYQTPVNITYTVANIVEQTTALAADSGSGGAGTIYRKSFTWTAPAAGTGTVSFWGVLNAVNYNGGADQNDKWNTKKLVVTEDTASAVHTGLTGVEGNMELVLYPNPVTDVLHLQVSNALPGTYSLNVFDITGKCISKGMMDVNGQTQVKSLDTNNWLAGIYFIQLTNNNEHRVIKIEKK